jgi:hypothetical protein
MINTNCIICGKKLEITKEKTLRAMRNPNQAKTCSDECNKKYLKIINKQSNRDSYYRYSRF